MKSTSDMKSTKGDLYLVEYHNPANRRRSRVWLFRKQIPVPDTLAVHHDLKTGSEDHAIVITFKDRQDKTHCHRYPMANVARTEQTPDDVEE